MTSFTILLLLAVSLPSALSVGLNCSGDSDGGCQEVVCPGDSVPTAGGDCLCSPEHCHEPPPCPDSLSPILKKTGTDIPGDCCDVYECPTLEEEESHCSEVICGSGDTDSCPLDSYRLPAVQVPGECCARSLGCACLPAPCPEPRGCLPPSVLQLVRPGDSSLPGSCCPIYQCIPPHERNRTCITDSGESVGDGAGWKRDECTECRCDAGVVKCTPSHCPPLPSSCIIRPPEQGRCCPSCTPLEDNNSVTPGGCKSGSGVIYANGAKWQEDDCISCTCYNGVNKCQAAMCYQTCPNATYVKGECCPKCNITSVVMIPPYCPSLADCDLKCQHGLSKDKNGCFRCICQEEDCDLKCEWGYRLDDAGMKLCECVSFSESEPSSSSETSIECKSLVGCRKKCKHGFRTDSNGCEICKCESCKSIGHRCNKLCPRGFATNAKGCPICKCYTDPKSGSTSKPCETDQGFKSDGEMWFDGCRHCYCIEGKEMCSIITCPKLTCSLPLVKSGECCPSCPEDTEPKVNLILKENLCLGDGWLKREGEEWTVGKCIKCRCTDGRSVCVRDPCPPAPCQYPVTPDGECCPVCPLSELAFSSQESCGGGQKAGETWREGQCVSCICVKGVATCHTEICDNSPCDTLIMVKNQCCPICIDGWQAVSSTGCIVGNATQPIGFEWNIDPCKRCTCLSGPAISCTRVSCTEEDDNTSREKWWNDPRSLTAFIFCFLVIIGLIPFLVRYCYSRKRYKLKLDPPPASPFNFQYKSVPTHEARAPV